MTLPLVTRRDAVSLDTARSEEGEHTITSMDLGIDLDSAVLGYQLVWDGYPFQYGYALLDDCVVFHAAARVNSI